MVTIQKTVHIGNDGVLRLELPLAEKERNVQVVVMVSEATPPAGGGADPWHELRENLSQQPERGNGMILPLPGPSKWRDFDPIELPGPSASEILLRDRR